MTKSETIKVVHDLVSVANVPLLKSVAMAQIINESGWLVHSPGHNCLGIKFRVGKDEGTYKRQDLKTKEWNPVTKSFDDHTLPFRAYDSLLDCIKDYGRFMGYTHYLQVQQADDFIEASTALRLCGYATSPKYDRGLRQTIINYKLYEYDYQIPRNTKITKDFYWWETFSNAIVDGKLYYRILEPTKYIDNAKRVIFNLQILRDHYKKPVVVTYKGCIYREDNYNASLSGSSKVSQHKTANGGDIKIAGIKPMDIMKVLKEKTDFKGFGIGTNYIHVDLRTIPAVWYY